MASQDLYRVSATGGNRILLAEGLPFLPRPSWGADGQIVYGAIESGAGLTAIPESGGAATVLTTVDTQSGEQGHGFPHMLPDGTVLFSIRYADEDRLARYFPDDGTRMTFELSGSGPLSYLSSGHFLFQRSGAIFAVSFDPDQGRVLGSARPVLGDANGFHLTVSQNGTAAYVHWPQGSG